MTTIGVALTGLGCVLVLTGAFGAAVRAQDAAGQWRPDARRLLVLWAAGLALLLSGLITAGAPPGGVRYPSSEADSGDRSWAMTEAG